MLQTFRTLSAPLFSLVLMMIASGLFNTFVSVRLELEGYGPEVIGIVTSALYMGILLGSLRANRWIEALGHTRSFTLFAIALCILTLLQTLWIVPWVWVILRLLGGVCTAGVFIVIESWLLMASAPNIRGVVLSLYLAAFYAALSFGQLLIDLSDPTGIYPFFTAAFLLFLSILPVTLSKVTSPKIERTVHLNLGQLFRISPLGFIGGVVSGMLLAAVYGLVPVFASEMGMNLSQIGTFMAIIIFGGFSLQWPLGRIADRSCRRIVLNGVSFMTFLLSLAIALVTPCSPYLLYPLAWLFGGFSFTIYPISMAYTCENVAEDQIVAATGGFVLSYSIGAVLGPMIAPYSILLFGPAGLFYFLGVITLTLGFIGLKKYRSSKQSVL
jgi:MFS family permease